MKDALDRVTPSELFLLAREIGPHRNADTSCVLAELKHMASNAPKDLTYSAISRAFGSPKPTLANSYEPELLNLRTFPTLMGYSSRIMAESWESNTLYWAALADEAFETATIVWVKIKGLGARRARIAWNMDKKYGCEFDVPLHYEELETLHRAREIELRAATRASRDGFGRAA